ncbi:3-deoxy-D-manno-octulosonic acid transferase [Oceanibacterium hippocampi]|uniref:3-deoxy-D-manno-octulosonic acid transferase n=1 Tax=Oceanibacterium hippocampi TaxID=745714 RepID=A0A1Y5SJX3_9PROT|nr:3-deoxy-D-manno-octulosonic acid transferase [Oceanibacterium hippocampi]SLN41316.1 3-deoxy-D-manno-octulosonic acid transferase [Oceanibacterium hippocampi]
MIGLGTYRALTDLSAPFIALYLARRRQRGAEDAERFGERLGRPGLDRPEGPLIWVHAASVGEALSVLPLIEEVLVRRPAAHVLLTTGTVSSAALARERLPARAFHQYVPVDRRAYVRRFLDHWRPDLGIWVESEIWPNLLSETAARGTPLILVNARMSERSFRTWGRLPGLIRPLIGGFALCLAQNEGVAERLEGLGARAVACRGDLKWAAAPLPVAVDLRDRFAAAIGARPVWVAASTHPGEEAMLLDVHRRLAARLPGLLTILVPRHPKRGGEIAALIAGAGLASARRSEGGLPDEGTAIYLGDSLGELGLFFRLAPVAFVGGSLVPLGGHNPLEPLRLGAMVLYGPHMENFADAVARLEACGAGERVADPAALADRLAVLLANPETSATHAAAGRRIADGGAGVLARVADEIEPFLPRNGGP